MFSFLKIKMITSDAEIPSRAHQSFLFEICDKNTFVTFL